jgi:hypothetical protein
MAQLPIRIRMANPYDLFSLELLLDKGIEESKGVLPNYDQLQFMHDALDRIASGFVYVACELDEAKKQEKVIGCLALEIRGFGWNANAKLLESVHFYVLPEYRGRTLPDGKTFVYEGLVAQAQGLADVAATQAEAPIKLVIENMHQVGPEARNGAKDELFKRAGLDYLGGKHLYVGKVRAQAGAAA